MESGLGTCLVAMRFGAALGLDEDALRRVYYLSLLQHVGCTAMNHELAAMFGDEIAMRAGVAGRDLSDPEVARPYILGVLSRAHPRLAERETLAQVRAANELLTEGRGVVCEVARMLGERMGFDEPLRLDLGMVYERWDGKGFPGRAVGGDLSVPLQVVLIADGARALHDAGGLDAVREAMPRRSGTTYGPEMGKAFLRIAPDLLSVLSVDSRWDELLDAEPGEPTSVPEEGIDDLFRTIADFADLKSPFLVGHSAGVAELAEKAARLAGLPEEDSRSLRRSGWIHDLGRVGVSASLWGKPGPLSASEWERVRLHAYYGERVFARVSWRPDLFVVATMHHERLNGTGYFRGAPASIQSTPARILAAADAFHAMGEPRPHRAALARTEAVEELSLEVRSGRIDPQAAEVVLQAAGERTRRRRTQVAGLTRREMEVLRLVARGLSTREVARSLSVSPKTADKHIENIYMKAGVSSRAAATLFAMEHDLLH